MRESDTCLVGGRGEVTIEDIGDGEEVVALEALRVVGMLLGI